jgi:hypothetical protein
MATKPVHLIGRHTNIQITPATIVDTTGVLTEVTASNKNFAGRADRFEMRNNPVSDEISAMDDVQTNEVVLKDNWSLTLNEIERYSEVHLADLLMGWSHFKITAIMGGKTWVLWCTYGPSTFPAEMGKSIASVEFRIIAIGADNPTYLPTA